MLKHAKTVDENFSPVPWLDVPKIRTLIKANEQEDREKIEAIFDRVSDELTRAKKAGIGDHENERVINSLGLEDIATLTAVKSPDLVDRLLKMAKDVKEYIYGNRIVTFAPLYFSNYCKNECSYCAFRVSNLELTRVVLSQEEIAEQTRILMRQGHKRVLIVAGESYPGQDPFQYVLDTMRTVYDTKEGKGEIRRVNANLAPLSVENYVRLKEAGVGTTQIFQETYDPVAYAQHHVYGKKADMQWRLSAFDRAIEAGLGDFGLGALLGLADWKFEILGLASHVRHLEDLGSGAHTISFPRIEPAAGSDVSKHPPHQVSDEDFLKVIAIMRLAVPYTGMIMSTRENPEMRRKTLECGISQVSAGSRTDPGGYTEGQAPEYGQFEVGDHRPLDIVVRELLENGFIPSWCTACEQKGREGNTFLPYARTGEIKLNCTPNALVTLKEYLDDYASPETKELGEETIAWEVSRLGPSRKSLTMHML
ncbi:MAG: [FeFe] hydrogenase H-cluster radical SAM maturase HydG, partial [Alphaproteobacteria bacterium]|nr:[FeFe] hydrogenase H-cluster radical SAM maturase HydG [Alphaproteobacteria bacterium]